MTQSITQDQIKQLTVIAMFSDDFISENLVLKGGNAMSLIHKIGSRSSADLDFSMPSHLPEDTGQFLGRVEKTLKKTFSQHGYVAFDVKMEEKPKAITEDMADFWGGYAIEFKLISDAEFKKYKGQIDQIRRRAVPIGQGRKFPIDLSRHEYTEGKITAELDGYRIYAYSHEMIVCEKLRAICQQMPEYARAIKRARSSSGRPRDFFDIHEITTKTNLRLSSEGTLTTLTSMFNIKRVPLTLLGKIGDYRDFHRAGFASLKDTVAGGTDLKDFDFYFDYVLDLVKTLKPLWDE